MTILNTDPSLEPASPSDGPWGADRTVAVVGLGYVGLPLAVAFGRRLPTIGLQPRG